jgi:hypothetical protein
MDSDILWLTAMRDGTGLLIHASFEEPFRIRVTWQGSDRANLSNDLMIIRTQRVRMQLAQRV